MNMRMQGQTLVCYICGLVKSTANCGYLVITVLSAMGMEGAVRVREAPRN